MNGMDNRFALNEGEALTEEQIREIENASQFPYVEDADSPEVDPEKNPELWKKALDALAKRNRRMAQKMA